MATILVTGATGTVGSEVVKQLSSSGQHVRGTVHSTTTAAFSKPISFLQFAQGHAEAFK
jgi:uncharacterized protein YbjT (DUF2867 family)